jgi:hypothetical protein
MLHLHLLLRTCAPLLFFFFLCSWEMSILPDDFRLKMRRLYCSGSYSQGLTSLNTVKIPFFPWEPSVVWHLPIQLLGENREIQFSILFSHPKTYFCLLKIFQIISFGSTFIYTIYSSEYFNQN